MVEDKERIIQNLTKQIATLSMDLSKAKSVATSEVKVTPLPATDNSYIIKEYEIKIRSLNSTIESLESKMRTIQLDYESQLRTKDNYIR